VIPPRAPRGIATGGTVTEAAADKSKAAETHSTAARYQPWLAPEY